MFIPNYFKVSDIDEIVDFVREHPFGIVVTTENGQPVATHLPMQLRKIEGEYYITGHVAYANPQWKTLRDSNEKVLVIFQGPHACISSSWYQHENVPTWNYQAVHIYGTANIMSDQELEEELKLLLQTYESDRSHPVLWERLSSKTKEQIKGIVGFNIKVEEIQAAYKLSQNRNDEDYKHIIKKLHEEDINSQQVAEAMTKQKEDFR